MELVPISVLKEQVGSSVGTVIVRKHGHRGIREKNVQNMDSIEHERLEGMIILVCALFCKFFLSRQRSET
jgi:hypothetical protein